MASGPDADASLTAVAAELYALPLARFTAERNARAKAVRAGGDRDLAARIQALPKPSAAAWLLDSLAGAAPDDLQRVLDLGAELRQAQEDADRDRLRVLTAERRTLLPQVARAAAARAEEAGQHVGDAVLEEVQQTLQAALGSPAAAVAIRSGRLVRALGGDGLDPVDLEDAVAGGVPAAMEDVPRRRPQEEDVGDRARREAEQRAEEHARRVEEARGRAREAASAARDADATAEDRGHDVDDLRRRVEDLQARLAAAERARDEAAAAAADAHEAADAAADEADRTAATGP